MPRMALLLIALAALLDGGCVTVQVVVPVDGLVRPGETRTTSHYHSTHHRR